MGLRILVADDHELVRDTISMFLESDGTGQVVQAGTLEDALKQMKLHGPFDLVLLDYTMPGMRGLEGLKQALKLSGGNPVGLISGTGTRLIAQQALDLGAAGFLPKTMPAKSLVNAVKFMAMGEFLPQQTLWRAKVMRLRQILKRLCQSANVRFYAACWQQNQTKR